jgi:tetratricopeptide (TPR) repeat protein
MKQSICSSLSLIGFLGFFLRVFAGDSLDFVLTPAETERVEEQLKAYDKGNVTREALYGADMSDGCRKLVGYYMAHSNSISIKAKLPLSRCLAGFGKYEEAAKVARDYANVYSNDFLGWEILAYCHVAMTNDSEAIDAYKKAIKLGDTDAYQALAGVAIRAHRLEVISPILSKLQELQRSKATSADSRINLTTLLTAYALMTDRRDIFVQTLSGQNLNQLMQDDIVRKNIAAGCDIFKGQDIDTIRQELESWSKRSTTNSLTQ